MLLVMQLSPTLRLNEPVGSSLRLAIVFQNTFDAPEHMKKFVIWLFARGIRERVVIDAAEKLQMSMRTTAKCRYNASGRLQHQGKFSFFTTTVLSLGLVFIPLMQNAGVPLAFQANVLNMMLIFLGVAVLV